LPQQKAEPSESVADGGEHGVDGIAVLEPETIATYAVFGLEMTDDGLDGGSAARDVLDQSRNAAIVAEMSRDREAP
jgi:hypothetical protein